MVDFSSFIRLYRIVKALLTDQSITMLFINEYATFIAPIKGVKDIVYEGF